LFLYFLIFLFLCFFISLLLTSVVPLFFSIDWPSFSFLFSICYLIYSI
jgi:hypothetical protein